jgi:hypothetical protein
MILIPYLAESLLAKVVFPVSLSPVKAIFKGIYKGKSGFGGNYCEGYES